jgi:hypothetical protein
MTTKAELIAQLKAENPTMTATLNDEKRLLSEAEYEEACNAWADMRLEQIAGEAEKAKAEADKEALLAKLGISADEAKLLLS